jgi:toxin ParE1/3/4
VKVRYRPTALAQLDAIFTYIEAHNPRAAKRVVRTIRQSIDRLGDFPYSAPRSELPGIRELAIMRYPYIVFYSVDEARQEVNVLRVRHTSRDPSGRLE